MMGAGKEKSWVLWQNISRLNRIWGGGAESHALWEEHMQRLWSRKEYQGEKKGQRAGGGEEEGGDKAAR